MGFINKTWHTIVFDAIDDHLSAHVSVLDAIDDHLSVHVIVLDAIDDHLSIHVIVFDAIDDHLSAHVIVFDAIDDHLSVHVNVLGAIDDRRMALVRFCITFLVLTSSIKSHFIFLYLIYIGVGSFCCLFAQKGEGIAKWHER